MKVEPIYPVLSITTSQKGATVTMIREVPKTLQLIVRHTSRSYLFRSAIVRGLHTAVDLSGPLLKTHGWDDWHSLGCLDIEGTQVPLVGHKMAEPPMSGIFALRKITIEARTGHNINELIPDVRGCQISLGLGCFKTGDKLH